MSTGPATSTIAAGAVIRDDGVVSDPNEIVDDRRRFFAAQQMLTHRADRYLRDQELRAAHLVLADAAEDQAGEPRETGLHACGLRGNPVAQRIRPTALQKIVA